MGNVKKKKKKSYSFHPSLNSALYVVYSMQYAELPSKP